MRVAVAAILGAVVAAALSAAAIQWLWTISGGPAGGKGFLAETGIVLLTLAGAILGGLGAAWFTMPRRGFFALLGLFILAAAGHWLLNPSPMSRRPTLYCDGTRASVPERLKFFVQLCQAVQHAQRN
jgi:hypothetical protein